jgi:hypothetical protein
VSNTAQVEEKEQTTARSALEKYVPGSNKVSEEELYAFRDAIVQKDQQEAAAAAAPPPAKLNPIVVIAGVVAVAALAFLLVFAIPMFLKPKVDNLYVDLGTERYDPAGLGGRLIAQWTGSTAYKFTIDPLDPEQIPDFQAIIANPPHAITFTLRLKDATGGIACQKDIVIPGTQESSDPADQAQAMTPHNTPTGDTIQDVTGNNGQIGEMVLSGALPCTVEAYKKIVAWDFTTDFPPLSDQKDWKKHEDKVEADAKKAESGGASAPRTYAGYTLVKSLSSPIEADDVIVSDNPSKGVVATGGGRAFLVGTSVLVNPALDWQIFPADVHYRCEKNAFCTLTRTGSRSVVRAHLLK